jgi:hypothetical protein
MNAQDLIDVEEIKQLKAKYFRLMDTKQWDDWVALFSETCEAIYEGYEPKRGGAEIVDFVRGMLDTGVTVHFGHMAEVVVTDSRSATGVWSMSDYLDCPGPCSFAVTGTTTTSSSRMTPEPGGSIACNWCGCGSIRPESHTGTQAQAQGGNP